MKKYRQLTTEITFRCNAKCPACHRLKPLRINLNDKKYTISVSNFKQIFYPKLLKNLEWLVFNGNFGDSVMNKDFHTVTDFWVWSSNNPIKYQNECPRADEILINYLRRFEYLQ